MFLFFSQILLKFEISFVFAAGQKNKKLDGVGPVDNRPSPD